MAELSGVTVTFTDYDGSGNPRLLNLPDTSDVSVQDLVDTYAAKQAELDNLIYERLYDAAGKESLGSGERVGITLTQNNIKIKYPDPGTPTVVRVRGGNTVTVDDQGNDINSVAFTNNVLAIVAQSSSATIREQEALEFNSYLDGIWIDPNNTTGNAAPGTAFPAGTFKQPVDNFADAVAIAANVGRDTLRILGGTEASPIPVDVEDFTGLRFVGSSPSATYIEVLSGATVVDTEYSDLDLRGEFDGRVFVERCTVQDASMVAGVIQHSRMRGDIVLSGTDQFSLLSCVDDIVGVGTPTIDFGGADIQVVVRDFSGGLTMTNRSGTNKDVSVDGTLRLVLESSFGGGGTVLVRGVGKVIDNSSGPTIDATGLVDQRDIELTRKIMNNRLEIDFDSQELLLYDDDNATVIKRWPVRTDGGEDVSTAEGVQTKRKAPL